MNAMPDIIRSRYWHVLMATALTLWLSGPARASEIVINEVQTKLADKVYYLDAHIDYSLTEPMYEALHKGVPLTFVLDIEIARVRHYWLNDTVAELQQRYQLEYQVLTQQYLVRNLNSGLQFNLPSLDVALSVLGTVVDLPVLDSQLLDAGESYTGFLRAQLDIEELPLPLRVMSYFSSEWRLRSEWKTWPF